MSFDQDFANHISSSEKTRRIGEVLLGAMSEIAVTNFDDAKTFDECFLAALQMRRKAQDALWQAVQISTGKSPEQCGAENIENLASPARAAGI